MPVLNQSVGDFRDGRGQPTDCGQGSDSGVPIPPKAFGGGHWPQTSSCDSWPGAEKQRRHPHGRAMCTLALSTREDGPVTKNLRLEK